MGLSPPSGRHPRWPARAVRVDAVRRTASAPCVLPPADNGLSMSVSKRRSLTLPSWPTMVRLSVPTGQVAVFDVAAVTFDLEPQLASHGIAEPVDRACEFAVVQVRADAGRASQSGRCGWSPVNRISHALDVNIWLVRQRFETPAWADHRDTLAARAKAPRQTRRRVWPTMLACSRRPIDERAFAFARIARRYAPAARSAPVAGSHADRLARPLR